VDTTRPELLSRFRRCLTDKACGAALVPEIAQSATEFWEFYDPILRRFLGHLAPRGLADDIYGAIWTGICEQLPRFTYDPTKGRFRSWLYRLAKNVTIDELKRRARQIQAELNNQSGRFWQAVVDGSSGEPSKALEQEWSATMAQAVTAVFRAEAPERELRTFELHFVERRSPAEISAAMGLSPEAVRQNISRVRKRLASIAKRLLGPGGMEA
jgi:RNA polymerase sigma-70 factor (ECF subfamily)